MHHSSRTINFVTQMYNLVYILKYPLIYESLKTGDITHMCKQCAPAPLPALWEGLGYEANLYGACHIVSEICVIFCQQISFAAALSSLSDRNRFKYYYRTTPTFSNYAPALVALLNNFKWKRIAFITQTQTLFVKVNTSL